MYAVERIVMRLNVFLVLQELEPLCEGLEGRSNNPVALLFDHLSHPDADLGLDNPSVLQWNHKEQAEIPHVVLGKARTGGTWQVRSRSATHCGAYLSERGQMWIAEAKILGMIS